MVALYLAFYLVFFLFYLSSEVNMDGSSHHRANAEDPEEFLHGVIRGEITYVPPHVPEVAGVDLGADEDDVDSWMNPSGGEGQEIEPFDDEGPLNDTPTSMGMHVINASSLIRSECS